MKFNRSEIFLDTKDVQKLKAMLVVIKKISKMPK